MTTIDFTVFDLDLPAGSKNKTATLITGGHDALLVDAGFTRADGHRLAAAVLDSGKQLTTVFVSHGDPDFYFGAEVLADAFPNARLVATPHVIEHIRHSYEGKLKAWATLGANLPTRLVELTPLTGDLALEGHRFELRGGLAALDPDLVVPGHRQPSRRVRPHRHPRLPARVRRRTRQGRGRCRGRQGRDALGMTD
ncbi:MBL fold metallo-hydrolase [Amycolatopsis sp. YIM 10]|uniref:MBL fold metallo-hydrolase n=1 Tax=Amycolatopsis sp. YIM 10 TaxID=2653857 RepID=UPI001D150C2D|nr:MBL fold metallo-hydrolase [Amycolatopsis sp. YIM 10]